MAERFSDLAWVFVYTNEAHPGEHLGEHHSFEEKLAAARRLRDEIGIRRPILVDGLDGAVHQAYGMCPNMSFVLGKGGLILYKAMWTFARRLEEFCGTLDRFAKPGMVPFYTEQLELRAPDRDEFQRRLGINGPRAVTEFARASEIWADRAREDAVRRREGDGSGNPGGPEEAGD